MTHLETQLLEKLRVLPTDKQHEVLDFVEFLITRANRHPNIQTVPAYPDPFIAAQQLRDSIQVQGKPLSASITDQRSEVRY